MVGIPIPVKKSSSPDWWMDSENEGTEVDPSRPIVVAKSAGGAELAASADTISEVNVSLAVVDTEYSQALPANCKGIEFVSRGGYPVRYAFTTGKVATPTGTYFILKSNCSYESPTTLNLSSKIIYFASDHAGDVVELIAWS
jgi:hypothetical protein